MGFKVGDRVVYPHHGAAVIKKKQSMEVAGESWGELLVWLAVGGLVAYGLLCVATAAWPDPQPDA